MTVLRLTAMLVVATGLWACTNPRYADYPPFEGTGFTDREWTQKERLLARSDFSVELVRFTDDRNPRNEAQDPADNLIYEYDPDQLMQGVTARLPVLLNKYLAYRPRMAKHYRVEMDLTRIKTQIQNGSLLDGQFGRYYVNLEARVVVRRSDSTVALNRPYSIELHNRRTTYNGRSPSAEMDRARMYDLTEDAVRQLCETIGWGIRGTDNHNWNPFGKEGIQAAPQPQAAEPAPSSTMPVEVDDIQ